MFLQEHWLSDGQLDQLGSLSPDHLFITFSGFDNSGVLSRVAPDLIFSNPAGAGFGIADPAGAGPGLELNVLELEA